jgi:signal transduction histidine kinase
VTNRPEIPTSMINDRPQMPSAMAQSVFLTGPLWVCAYVALDYISFVESYRGLAITPWNPAAGLGLALILLGGARFAPVVLVSPAIAGALVRIGSVPVTIHLVEGLLFGGSYLAAGLLARRHGKLDPRLGTVGDILHLMFFILCAAVMAALSYVGVLGWAGLLPYSEMIEGFIRFVIGDLIGMLIVTPIFLLTATRRLWSVMTLDAPLKLFAIALAFAAIFAIPHASEYQLFYLLFLPLLWFTVGAGIAGAAAALSVIQVGLILALHIREGAIADLPSFQILMISLAVTGLVLGSMVTQQQATSVRLRNQQLALSRALRLRSMGEIATVIAHEVNQPITSIRTYAGIAKDALKAEQPQLLAEAVGRIRAECDRASAIIRSTRENLRHQKLQPRVVEVPALLAEMKDLLVDRLKVNDIEMIARVHDGAGTVFGDPVQLKQALYNIVDNSVDAIETSGAPGSIVVDVRASGPSTTDFVVSDSGPGFAQDATDFGIMPLMSTKPDGTGIGLTIARSVAEAHGGALSIEREDKRTIVRLRISSGGQTANEDSSAR